MHSCEIFGAGAGLGGVDDGRLMNGVVGRGGRANDTCGDMVEQKEEAVDRRDEGRVRGG